MMMKKTLDKVTEVCTIGTIGTIGRGVDHDSMITMTITLLMIGMMMKKKTLH